MDRNEKFINDAKKKFGDDYEYLTKYKNQYQKLKIRCVKHDHVFIQQGKQHLKAEVPCSIRREEVRKEKIEQEFTEKFEKKYPKLKVLKYIHGTTEAKSEVAILFKECGHTEHFASGNDYVLNRGDECPTCHPHMKKMHDATNARWGSSKDKRFEEIKAKLEKIHDNAFEYDEVEFTGNKRDKAKILCKKHDSYFFQSLSDHEKGGVEGCPECKKEGQAKRGLEKEIETFNRRIKEIPHLKPLTAFLGWGEYLEIECSNCGEVVKYNEEQETDNLYSKLFGKSKFGCPNCSLRGNEWEEKEIQKLFLPISSEELAEKYLTSRTLTSIKSKRSEMGATATRLIGRRSWLAEEEAKKRVDASRKKYENRKIQDPVYKFKK